MSPEEMKVLFPKAAAVAGAIAAIFVLLGSLPWKSPRTILASLSQIVGVAVAFGIGCWLLGVKLDWPTDETGQTAMVGMPGTTNNFDRLLVIVAPAVFVVEVFASLLGRFRAIAWIPRLAIAALTARVIMDGCTYIKDWDGPGSALWKQIEIYLYLGLMGAALAVVWAGVHFLAKRPTAPWSVPLALAIACAGGGINVLVAGDSADGQLGVPLAGALVGVAAATAILGKPCGAGTIGFGSVLLFAILIGGLFFGKLSATNAAIIFAAPMLGWISELPPLNKLKPVYRGILRVVVTAAPIILVVAIASQQALKDLNTPASSSSDTNEADWYK